MIRSTSAPTEESRLAALHALALVGTPPEERFDRITRLAQQFFDVPIVVMTLVDREQQHMKSRQGTSLRTLARKDWFCDQIVAHGGVLVVEDVAADPHYRDHDLVRGVEGIRFYAGHALSTRDGHRVGTLCLLDRAPRRFGQAERRQLADFARLLERELTDVQLAPLQSEVSSAREELRKFFSLSLDLLCIAGTDGTFRKLNPAWEATLGWTVPELMSRPYLEFVHPEDRDRTLAEAKLLEKGNVTVSFENRWRTRAGGYRHLLWSAASDRDSGLVYAVARDISALRAAEDELRRSRTLAEAASHAKNRFLTNMSHEFRTPLNSVLGFTSVMLEEASDLSARHRSFLERIQANGRDLLFLVNDILDLARIESGQSDLEPEPVDLSSMVAAVIQRHALQAEQKGLELRAEIGEPLGALVCDARRLKQVLVNIVGNAVKFTESGHVTVHVVTDPASGRPLRVEIEDSGIGISYEQQDRIFVAFHQGEGSVSRRFAGTGLGLTISRSLCEVLGYQLQLWSRMGVGTTFTIHLVPPGAEVR